MEALVKQVQTRMSETHEEIADQTINAKKTGVTSDDVSEAMMPFFDDIERVRSFPNREGPAFELLMDLASSSYGELDMKGCGYGERPSDCEVDQCLVEVAKERRARELEWHFEPSLDYLKEMADLLGQYGIEDFCLKPLRFFRAGGRKLPSLWNHTSTNEQFLLGRGFSAS